jgi:transposase-like protein
MATLEPDRATARAPALSELGCGWCLVAGSGRKNADPALIVALAGGCTVEDAARQVGVGETTIYRRLAEPEFRQQVDEARREMLTRAVGKLADAGTEAATTLRLLLTAESETVRLGACRAILELGAKLRESEELERRIAAVEERQAAQAARSKGGRRWPV